MVQLHVSAECCVEVALIRLAGGDEAVVDLPFGLPVDAAAAAAVVVVAVGGQLELVELEEVGRRQRPVAVAVAVAVEQVVKLVVGPCCAFYITNVVVANRIQSILRVCVVGGVCCLLIVCQS